VFVREFQIGTRRISDTTPCYVIGEIGHNHQGKLDTARALIQSCATAGVDAVKFQKRDVETLYSRSMLEAPYEHENSFGPTYGAHRRALEFGMREYIASRTIAKAAGVEFLATAFDERSADFLMEVGVPALKIASGGLTDHVLLRHVGRLGVPIILSTGGACWHEIDNAVELLQVFPSPLALLHCTAAYPVTQDAELNLRAIPAMRERYPHLVIGWSSHDPGVSMSLIAYAYGARILEKHVTLNRAMKGTDHAFSLEPKGVQVLCEDLKRAHLANGDGIKRLYDSERKPLAKMRRVQTMSGMKITGEMSHAAFH
jgi:sialic acid synthase